MPYQPREDSYLLEKWVKILTEEGQKVLDVGTGSGIQALAALANGCDVVAVDIDEETISSLKEKAPGIAVKKSDLFSAIHGKFDVIIFNPPYLPQDEGIEDNSIYGGKLGYETTVKFIRQAKNYLNKDGFILLLFSSLTNKKKVDEALEKSGYTWSTLDKKSFEFERLYVYKGWVE